MSRDHRGYDPTASQIGDHGKPEKPAKRSVGRKIVDFFTKEPPTQEQLDRSKRRGEALRSFRKKFILTKGEAAEEDKKLEQADHRKREILFEVSNEPTEIKERTANTLVLLISREVFNKLQEEVGTDSNQALREVWYWGSQDELDQFLDDKDIDLKTILAETIDETKAELGDALVGLDRLRAEDIFFDSPEPLPPLGRRSDEEIYYEEEFKAAFDKSGYGKPENK